MKISALFLLFTAAVSACPGTDGSMRDLHKKLRRRQAADPPGPFDSNELIGDLATVGATTKTGSDVLAILQGTQDPYSDVRTPFFSIIQCLFPGHDTCCIWQFIANDMENLFRGTAGRCNALARAAVRQGFHDAGAWSKTSGFGGADGSLILGNEITRTENNGLQEIIGVTQMLFNTYKSYGIGMADLIQMGATVATVVCPLGPRVRSFVGRKDNATPAPPNLLPSVFASADSLIQLFKDKTIKEHGLTALVGAHTTSQQLFVDPSRALDPQDSTPGVWDVLFYNQTIDKTSFTPPRVFRFPSDVVLSQHPNIQAEWLKFAGGNQEDWNEDFSKEYVRLSLLGVNNINSLTECTKILPAAVKSFRNPDQTTLMAWLNNINLSKTQSDQIANALNSGGILTAFSSIFKNVLGNIFGIF